MASNAGVTLSTTSAYTITATSAVSAVDALHLHLAHLPDARVCFEATVPGKGRRRIARAAHSEDARGSLARAARRRPQWDSM
jgi:hypothetical protein